MVVLLDEPQLKRQRRKLQMKLAAVALVRRRPREGPLQRAVEGASLRVKEPENGYNFDDSRTVNGTRPRQSC